MILRRKKPTYSKSLVAQTYFFNVKEIKSTDNLRIFMYLPSWKLEEIDACKNELDKKRSIASWKLVSNIIEDHNADILSVYRADTGKLKCSGLEFNISHSGELIFGVASESPVGCDIEKLREVPKKLSTRIFTQNEIDYINSGPTYLERKKRYLYVWTAKESYLKMIEDTSISNLADVEVDPENLILRNTFHNRNYLLIQGEMDVYIYSYVVFDEI